MGGLASQVDSKTVFTQEDARLNDERRYVSFHVLQPHA